MVSEWYKKKCFPQLSREELDEARRDLSRIGWEPSIELSVGGIRIPPGTFED